MDQGIHFDPALIRRYDKSGPRYTSYPTAVQFTPAVTAENYREYVQLSNNKARPLSVYVHLPFCDTVCFYCACNKIITKNRQHAIDYLQRLDREISLQGQMYDRTRQVIQLHWGGGTPTFINHAQMTHLMQQLRQHFTLLDDDAGEYSIEVDPRRITSATITHLRKLGFNRMSLGVQDFDSDVQKAVNRIQTEKETVAILQAARKEQFKSINIDLIYGLPFQTTDSFALTLDKIIDIAPDRLSIFNYAHLPEVFKTQRQIRAADLPSPPTKMEILQLTIDKLLSAGYVYIGMDHFARPDDELAIAQRDGSLTRNFQGYSTRGGCDLVAMGITAIGKVGRFYYQNVKTLDEYYRIVDGDQLPVMRGLVMNDDDCLRAHVIRELICHFTLDIVAVEESFGIDFDSYFKLELAALAKMHKDRLLDIDQARIQVLPRGKLLIRNICMHFDRYLHEVPENRFSRVI